MHQPRTAQNGTGRWFSADPATLTRLSWMKHAAEHFFNAQATNSTLVRRALEHYEHHLGKLLSPRTNPERIELERLRLIAANRGGRFTLPVDLLTALPVRKLSAISKDYRASQPRLIDQLKEDLAIWERRETA